MSRKLKTSDVKWTLIAHPEDLSIRGNAIASGDDAYAAEVERQIQRQLDNGNEWAWCCVELRGEFEGLTASDYLGCCSYNESEKDFRSHSGYFEDMEVNVLSDLQGQLDKLVEWSETN